MTTPQVRTASRRALLAGACAACAAALAGCARYDSNNGGIAGGAPAQGGPPAQSGASAQSSTGSSAAVLASPNAPAVLASTADIPVGGGKILPGQKIVITQPQAGSFDAFTAVCTHQGCLVATVSGGTINCPCHGSKFSIANGSVVNGPATSPLAPVSIKVQGTSIVQA
jgi:nitrite reductase/ring-hydroxylating ferredoxin subunit